MIQKITKYKYEGNTYDSFSQLKQAHPYTSFPAGADEVVLASLGIEKVDEYPPLKRCKEIMRTQAGMRFAHKRDATRWIELGGTAYGIDCAPEDITNFMAAKDLLRDDISNWDGSGEAPRTFYKVWLSETTKDKIFCTMKQLIKIQRVIRDSQLSAYMWYESKKAEINKAENMELLLKITMED